jgi:hypothetical protein
VKSRRSIAAVYGPVLLAALLILTAAPACAMPDCGLGGNGVASACGPTQQFKSACESGPNAPVRPAPCHDGSCNDTVMSHGNPDGTVVDSVEVPAATAVGLAPRIPALVSLSISRPLVALVEPHPPDPLGVRLTV